MTNELSGKIGQLELALANERAARKKAENELKKCEFFLNRSQKIGGIGCFVLDIPEDDPGRQTWESTPEMDRIFGIDTAYPRTGESWLALIVQREEVSEYFSQQVFKTHRLFEKEYQVLRPSDGEVRWIFGRGELEFDGHGNCIRMIGTVQDITERKQAEKALKESEKRYRSLIKLSPLGIGVINTDGVIVDGNQALASMLGYETEALLGMTLGDITHPDDLKSENELIDSLVNNAETSFSMEKRYRHKDGDYFWVNVSVAKALDIAGSGVFVFGFVEDISRRKQMELEKEKLITELKNALAEIKELRGFLPICSNCKKIRDDAGYWQQVEKYITDRTDAKFSHGICPDCAKELYPQVYKALNEKKKQKE